MLVVHATWRDSALLLWGEYSARALNTKARGDVRVHPYAAPTDNLVDATGVDGDPTELTLLLPGSTTSPAPSPELSREAPRTQGKLHRWLVPALAISSEAALSVLASVDDDGHVIHGSDIRYLAVVAGFACDLVQRGRILPSVVSELDGFAARWRPVLIGPDTARRRGLAEAMPPICRAYETVGGGRQPSSTIVDEMLLGIADSVVRHRLDAPITPLPKRAATISDRWLAALSGSPVFADRDEDITDVREPLDDWYAEVSRATGPVRVLFRLAEPDGEAAGWRVDFVLQSTSDQSLVIPADQVWNGATIGALHADEELLAGLGRASRLFPLIDTALHEARPACLPLDTEEAYRFLKHQAPLLRAAGFGVQLPAWVGASRLGVRLTTRSAAPTDPLGATTGGGFSLDDLVAFQADLALGDHIVSAEELAELARLKVPLVRVRGQWVELDDRQLAAALKFMQGPREGTMTGRDVLNEVVHGGGDLPLAHVEADGALGDLLSGRADQCLSPIPTPKALTATLRPYQERGLAWLSFLDQVGLGAVLADDMGLGKTVQVLALLAAERADGDHPPPTLVVAPMSLVGNWRRETERFVPSLRTYVHHGPERRRGDEFASAVAAADLVITTYGTATRDRDLLATIEWARVVCDEAQAIKNSATKQATAVRGLPAMGRIALTGTPVENRLGELWSIMEFANPGLLGPASTFRRRYSDPIEDGNDPEAAAALRRATQPFILRRLKTDRAIISDLPEKQEIKLWCNLTPEQASLYQATVDDMLDKIANAEGIERRGLVLATMTKLKQACNHPAHLLKDGSALPGRSGKLARLEEILDELLSEGDKALVFTQYAEFGSLLQPYLAAHLGRPVLWLHGGVPKKRRDQLIERFHADDEPSVFLLSLKAAGTGLNLTAANHVIHVDRWWNPAVEDQATDRAFRIGQRRDVQVRKFICIGTLEERIDTMIERKKALAERIVGTGEDWLTELSVAELREVVALAPEAVSGP
ncbi:MAG TPA: DEAD/DEAH box helicase [Jiangellales bacterium]|nr:DEAD/DEAH box helicase [Jiangellales bacterium]